MFIYPVTGCTQFVRPAGLTKQKGHGVVPMASNDFVMFPILSAADPHNRFAM